MNLAQLAHGVAVTMDPNDGDGWRETIIASLMIVGTFALMFLGREIPSWLIGLISLVAGFYFGDKVRKHNTQI